MVKFAWEEGQNLRNLGDDEWKFSTYRNLIDDNTGKCRGSVRDSLEALDAVDVLTIACKTDPFALTRYNDRNKSVRPFILFHLWTFIMLSFGPE